MSNTTQQETKTTNGLMQNGDFVQHKIHNKHTLNLVQTEDLVQQAENNERTLKLMQPQSLVQQHPFNNNHLIRMNEAEDVATCLSNTHSVDNRRSPPMTYGKVFRQQQCTPARNYLNWPLNTMNITCCAQS